MEAIVFSGIQGAGKSTFYRDRFFATHVRINLDMLRTRHRESILLHACLAAQQPFVIDNTNPRRANRARYRNLAAAAGFRTVLYWFDVPAADAVARNAGRADRARVPEVAIYGTMTKLERPTADEGFDAMHVVRIDPTGAFVVEPWTS